MLKKSNSFYRFGKLLKYELLSCGKIFLPLYATLLLISFINSFTFSSVSGDHSSSTFSTIMIMMYFGLFVASIVVNIIILVQRFKKNLLGNEAYLSLSLPVGISNHIAAKLVSALICSIVCGIVAVLSVLLLSMQTDSFAKFIEELEAEHVFEILSKLNAEGICIIFFELPITILLSVTASILMVYAAISIGHLVPKSRPIAELLSLVILATIQSQAISGISRLIGGAFTVDTAKVSTAYMFTNHNLLLYSLVFVAFAAVYFGAIYYILTKRLNLE